MKVIAVEVRETLHGRWAISSPNIRFGNVRVAGRTHWQISNPL